MKMHHVGYLVRNIQAAEKDFNAIGFEVSIPKCFDAGRGCDFLFMTKDGYQIELVAPRADSAIVPLLKKFGNSPYHFCYESAGFAADIANLQNTRGGKVFCEPAPAPALGGRKVAFLMNPNIGIIEILEK